MLKKRNLLFLSLLILGILFLTSCFLNPPATEGILKGQVMVPEGTLKAKDLTGQALPDATVNIIDLTTGAIIATTVTDTDGHYQVSVPPGGPYLLEAVKGSVKLEQITCSVEVGIEYDLGTVDCATTAVSLIAQAMLEAEDYPDDPADINLTDIEADPDFDDVMGIVCSILEASGDPAESAAVQQAIENFLHPPAPTPTSPSTPTYTVTYNGNGSTSGTVPSDANKYKQGASVTVLGNTGNLVKTQDGISLLFTGWNTAADGSGTDYIEDDTFNMGSGNLTLYAQWSVVRGTGPAGGLIFYDKGSVSDGWRYLEAAPDDQSTGIYWGCVGTLISGADGTVVGTGKQNTMDIETGCTEADTAADICADLDLGGYNDWFFPSKDELNLMYENLKVFVVGGFADYFYWSSSEANAFGARDQYFYFGSGSTSYHRKDNVFWVRAVRAFRSTEPTYLANYNANEATGGTVPSDGYYYEPGETVPVLSNTGSLVKTDYTFDGWNTAADGSGTDQAEGSNFTMGASDVTLYAKWAAVIDTAEIPGVTAPVTGATPVTAITETAQYTGTVTWSPDNSTFGGAIVYTAIITLTAKTGFTLDGVAADFFTVAGATTTNAADSGVVSAVFPETAAVAVGDSCGGGIVAYILQDNGGDPDDPGYDANVQHGLIAATADQSEGIVWAIEAFRETEVTGILLTIGSGSANTDKIIAQNGAGSTYAAGLARAYDGGGYHDWFLPSKDELNKLYINQVAIGDFVASYYWSSSEDGAGFAWGQGFGHGYQYHYVKYETFRVRAVRAF